MSKLKKMFYKVRNCIYLIINHFLFYLKSKFFENDIRAFKWTLAFFFIPIFIYFIIHKVFPYYSIVYFKSYIDFITFLGLWATITGMSLAFLVMLHINNKKTKSGTDFIQLLSNELYKLSKGDEITIISPNMNIGSFFYRGESLFETAIKTAIKKEAKIKFITIGIDKNYLEQAENEKEIISLIINGEKNKSPQLTYIYERYIRKETAKERELNKIHLRKKRLTAINIAAITIDELNWLLKSKNIEVLYHCEKEKFNKIGLTGFFTKDKFYIGRIEDIKSNKGEVNVIGESIELKEIIPILSTQIKRKYKKIIIKQTKKGNAVSH